MKKNYLVLLIIFFTFPCLSQVEWAGDFEKPLELKTFIVSSQNHHIINFTYAPSGSSEVPAAIAIDGMGNDVILLHGFPWEIWTGVTLVTISDIIELSDSSLVFPNIHLGVDAGGTGNFGHRVAKIDNNLENVEWYNPQTPLVFGHELSDNGFVLYGQQFSQPAVGRIGSDCLPIWNMYMDFQLHDLTITTDDQLIWAGSDGLAIMDIDGTINTIYPDFMFEEVLNTQYDGIVGLNQDTLYFLSSNIEFLDSFGFHGDHLLDYSVRNDKVAVLTESRFVYLFNDSLILQDSFELLDESEFRLIDIGHDGVAVAGVETYGSSMPNGGTQAPFTKDYSFSGDNYDLSRDVGVVDIQSGAVKEVVLDFGSYKIFYKDAQVTVENFGDHPVSELYIRTYNTSWLHKFSQKFSGITLLPNETITLTLDDFWIRTDVEPGGFQSICMWTSHPDKKLDSNSTNDGHCTEFLVDSKEVKEGKAFGIYPNPSMQEAVVSYQLPFAQNGEIKMYNSMGVLLYRESLTSNLGILHLPKKAAGIYYVTLLVDEKPIQTIKYVQF